MAWNDDLEAGTPAFGIAGSEHERMRVIAGPGTGKSFAMKRRVARLLEVENVPPERILAVTFTRVAAEDLHRELVGLGVEGANDLRGRTLHSLAMSILMQNHVLPVLGRHPRPLNDFELEPLLEDLSADHGNKHQRRRQLKAFGAAWARLQVDEPGFARTEEDQAFSDDVVDWLTLHEAMLMDEVVPQLLQYLRANPGCPELDQYDHLLIDEYQDLNRAEQDVLRLLGQNSSMCVIGDDDQSIYSFKHAHPEGIRVWGHPDPTEEHAIAECRRCPTAIVRMANTLISRNPGRPGEAMVERPENGQGEVVVRQYPTVEDEAAAVAEKISELIETGVQPREIIVLAQRKTFANPIYRRLLEEGIPTKSYYAESSLDSLEAQERLALLKLFLNNEDKVALRWLLGFGHQRWRKTQYARILEHTRQTGQSQWATLVALADGGLVIPHVRQLVERFEEIRAQLDELENADGFDGFLELWLQDNEETRLLADEVSYVLDDVETPAELLDKLIENITRPDVPMEVAEVRVMSLHKSKGLSAPFVFVVGCVEGLLPGQLRPPATQAERDAKIQEDRRLFYVGITRAKAQLPDRPGYLALSYARGMLSADAHRSNITPVRVQGGIAELRPSRFLAEMNPHIPHAEYNTTL